MAKKGKRNKKNKIDINIAVVILVLLSLLLMILIYNKSGIIGEMLSPMLGGVMGVIKYIIPIGMLLIAIYITQNDKEYLVHKLIQYGIFLVCVATMLSIFQFANGNLDITKEFSKVLEDSYELGERNIGGGAIGGIIAIPLIDALGIAGAVIVTIGISVILLVFMFGIRPAEMISNMLDRLAKRKAERLKEKKESLRVNNEHQKESKKDRRLREVQEAESIAPQLESQLKINLDEQEKLKKYDHSNDELDIPFFGKGRKEKINNEKIISENVNKEKEIDSPNVIDANLFKKVEEKKEDKVKEVLQLEHTLIVEDDNYEFPPIQLLSEPEKEIIELGKKHLQKLLQDFKKLYIVLVYLQKLKMYQ